ncbi:MAG: BMP family ABC transporter substrate-binding protein [Candidatus Thorarchaeota archaeon]|nr:MAG: BMP family ABC transporter substrate-binding protein [Candidatus Thorarchaeota archaeon]
MVSKGTMAALVIVIIAIGGAGAYIVMFDPFGPQTNPHEVAVVFATGQLGDKSFNDGVKAGMDKAVTDLGISYVFVEPLAIADYETFLRDYATHAEWIEPYDLILAIGFDQEVALQTVANESTDQKFGIIDMFIDPIVYPNVASLLFDEHEGSALVGAIAGLTTTTDKIGFVGGVDIPLIHKFAAGYLFGAGYVNPQLNGSANIAANFSMGYTNDWVDTTAAQTMADGMYDAGADIIYAAAGGAGLGLFDSVKDKNATSSVPLWAIGVDSPQMYLGTADTANPVPPTVTLTSMLKRVDVAAYNLIESWVIDGVWDTGFDLIYSFNLVNGGVGYEVNTDLLTLPPAVITEVEAFKTAIIAGDVVVPDDYFWTP